MAHQLSIHYWPDSEHQPRWAEVIGSTYFPLSLEFAPNASFSGTCRLAN